MSHSPAPASTSDSASMSSDPQPSEPSKSPSPPSQKSCANCKKIEDSADPEESPNLKPCISCKSVLYCCRDCKKAHTKQHKKVCASLAQEYSKTADIKMASRSAPKADTHRGGLQKWQFDT